MFPWGSYTARYSSFCHLIFSFFEFICLVQDTLQIESFDDPKVRGITLYISNFQRPLTERWVEWSYVQVLFAASETPSWKLTFGSHNQNIFQPVSSRHFFIKFASGSCVPLLQVSQRVRTRNSNHHYDSSMKDGTHEHLSMLILHFFTPKLLSIHWFFLVSFQTPVLPPSDAPRRAPLKSQTTL